MTTDIQIDRPARTATEWVLLALTLLLTGRAMTLAFLSDVGGSGAGDPPAAWLMPLVGDAVVGLSAIAVAVLLWRRAGLTAWLALIIWNAIAIWDALSAFLVNLSVPWPGFFMLEMFGWPMFFLAAGMHALCILLASRRETRRLILGPQNAAL